MGVVSTRSSCCLKALHQNYQTNPNDESGTVETKEKCENNEKQEDDVSQQNHESHLDPEQRGKPRIC